MATPEERIAALGLTLPTVVPPLASYLPAVRADRFVFTSGQLPLVDGTLVATGVVGDTVSPKAAQAAAQICALNALAAITSVTESLSVVRRIVKVVGFVASAPTFTAQPAVVNGASDFLREVFGEIGTHARSAVGVSSLPLGAPVEVEMVVEVA